MGLPNPLYEMVIKPQMLLVETQSKLASWMAHAITPTSMENVRKDDHQFSTLHTQKANIEIKGSNKQSKDLDFRWDFLFP